jgi:putative transcriptional regulator
MAPTPPDGSLAPGFLVAAPALRDPNFNGSLVLMAQHGADGALGFVVNRAAQVRAGEVLQAVDPALRALARAVGRDGVPVLQGGPVQPERLWILWRPGVVPAGEEHLRVARGVALGGSRDLLESVARNDDAGPYQLLLGYAGWGPMQLEGEVSSGAWIPMGLDEDLLFDVPLEERWAEAVRRLGLDPGGFSVGGGGAQA